MFKVDELDQRFVPDEGWIHGRNLRNWYDARNRAIREAREILGVDLGEPVKLPAFNEDEF